MRRRSLLSSKPRGPEVVDDFLDPFEEDYTALPNNQFSSTLINQAVSLTSINISDSIYGDDSWYIRSENNHPVSWIRANSHRYVGKYDPLDGMILRQLDDKNSELYSDGSDAYWDIRNPEYDVFMKMPTFWYRFGGNSLASISFTLSKPTDEDGWFKWDGRTLIGAYQSTMGADGFHSVSHGKITTGQSWESGKQYTRSRTVNNVDKFSMITYETHKIMDFLYMAYYFDVDIWRLLDSPSDMFIQPYAGRSNKFSMRDSNLETFTSFWGLEYWVYNYMEILDNLLVKENFYLSITDYYGNDVRKILNTAMGYELYPYLIIEMMMGEYGDLLPASLDSFTTSDTIYYTRRWSDAWACSYLEGQPEPAYFKRGNFITDEKVLGDGDSFNNKQYSGIFSLISSFVPFGDTNDLYINNNAIRIQYQGRIKKYKS